MRTGRQVTWQHALMAGAVILLGCAVLPADTAGLLSELAGVAGMIFLVRGARRHGAPDLKPIRLIAYGGSAFLAGNVVRVVYGGMVGVDSPFPSPAEPLYFIGYFLIGAGLLQLVRRRSADIEGDNVLDAVLVATCIGVLAVDFGVVPFLARDDVSAAARAITLSYTVLDMALMVGLVRLAVGSGRRSPSYYLLGGSITSIVMLDCLLNLASASATAQYVVVAVSAVPYVLAAASGLHPSIVNLTDRPEARDIQLTSRRLGVLFAVVVGLIVLLTGSVLWAGSTRVIVAAVGAVAAILIVLGRLAMLVQANEHKATREALLRDAAGALARATSIEDMYAAATPFLVEVVGSGSAWAIETGSDAAAVVAAAGLPLDADRRSHSLARAVGALAAAGDECVIDDSPVADDPRLVLAVRVAVGQGQPAALVAATDKGVARQVLHALETLAAHLAGAIDGLLLAEATYRREQEQRFRALIVHSSDLVTVLDDDGLVIFASPACVQLLGVEETHLIGRHPFERVHPDDRFNAASLLDRSWAVPGVLDPIEVRFRHESGEWRWFEVLIENLLEESEVGAVIIHTRDVTDRRKAQEELAAREARFRSLVQHTADIIAIVDDQLVISYISPAARSMLGYEPDALVGHSITELIPSDQLFVESLMLPSMSEAHIRDVTGRWRDAELTITDLRHDPAVAGIVINARDVSERKTLEDKLRHLAMHDPLTGLANRNLLHERLGVALNQPNSTVAVLYIDIDDFKALNDSLGHTYGDTALCEVARRLSAGVRDSDLVARLGGDEFAVLLDDVTDASPMEVAERLLDAIRAPVRLGSQTMELTVSLGAAVSEPDSDVASLTRNADIAMYLAKTDGKDRRQLFVPEMLEAFNERIELKRDLQGVIDRGELRLVYQPVYQLRTGRMTSVEALVRWDHPTRGLIPPLHFIPLAEESGVILDIGSWVLDEACSQLAAWRRAGGPSDLAMGVNLSVAQLEREGLLAEVETTLLKHGLEPGALVLEVTESVLAANVDLVQLQLSGLAALGVRLALDDFGTGYSSLGYLQHFELDTLKIDKSFLGDTKDPSQQEGLVRAIIDLAGNRGMTTVAEGVEEPAQLAMLARLGCTSVQGYLFAKPLPPDEVLGATDRATPYVEALQIAPLTAVV